MQIVSGSCVLLVCVILHIVILLGAVRLMMGFGRRSNGTSRRVHWVTLYIVALLAIVGAHTAQVWLWAATFIALSALPDMASALYFALVTYTTLGYGDVTVSEGHRIFAAMAAVAGLLSFGLSTAFLVALFGRTFPDLKAD